MPRRILTASLVVTALTSASVATQGPKTHRLEATPETVAWGYYWSQAKPVLRVASGDIVDVDTLLTNQGHDAGLAARGNRHGLHRDGDRP